MRFVTNTNRIAAAQAAPAAARRQITVLSPSAAGQISGLLEIFTSAGYAPPAFDAGPRHKHVYKFKVSLLLVHRRTAYLLLSVSLLYGAAIGIFVPIFPLFAVDELGATYEDLGLIWMVSFLPYVLIPLMVGMSFDKINSRYLLAAGFALNAVLFYLTAISTTIAEVMLYRCLGSFARSLVWPPALRALSHDPKTRVKYTAMFAMLFVVGQVVGPLIGWLMLDIADSDYRLLLLVPAVLMGLGVVAIIPRYPRPRDKGSRLDFHLFGEILKFPVLAAVLLFSATTFGIVIAVYPAFLHERGMDGQAIMQLFIIFGVVRSASFLLAKKMTGLRGPALALATACIVAAMAVSAAGSTFVEFAAAMVLMGLGFSFIHPLGLDIILSGSRKVASGRLIGIYEALFGVGWTLGPLAGGYVGHNLGATNLYWLTFAIGAGVLLLALLFRNKINVTIKVLKYGGKSRKERRMFVKQELKNHFNTILANAGIMNRALKKAEAHDDIPDNVMDMHRTIIRTASRVGKTLDTASGLLDAALVGKINELTARITETDPVSGAGSGYPEYDYIKKTIEYCTYRLDVDIGDDAVFR